MANQFARRHTAASAQVIPFNNPKNIPESVSARSVVLRQLWLETQQGNSCAVYQNSENGSYGVMTKLSPGATRQTQLELVGALMLSAFTLLCEYATEDVHHG